jgi:hypothetical protein
VPYIQKWSNSILSSTTGYEPIELLNGSSKPDIFRKKGEEGTGAITVSKSFV